MSTIPVSNYHTETVNIKTLKPHPKNPRIHPESALNRLVKSIKEYGWTNPVLVSEEGYILAGHARVKAAEIAGITEVPIIRLPLSGDRALAYLLADNKLQDMTEWDYPILKDLLEGLNCGQLSDIEITGFGEKEIEDLMTQFHVPDIEVTHKALSERFIVPPFSVLDARQGYWQERKRAWLALGMQSELGRGGGVEGHNNVYGLRDRPNQTDAVRRIVQAGSRSVGVKHQPLV